MSKDPLTSILSRKGERKTKERGCIGRRRAFFISLSYSSIIMAYSSQKSGYFQHLKQSDQIFSGSSVRWTS